MELHYGIHSERVVGYHYAVLGLALQKRCPHFNEEDILNRKTMTAGWFNRIVSWLTTEYPTEFRLKNKRRDK